MIKSAGFMVFLILLNAVVLFAGATSLDPYGLPFIVAGGIIYFYHKHLMGRVWSLKAEPKKELVRAGLFKYVRHPLYLGALVALLGLILSTSNLLLLLVFVFFTFPVIYARAKIEERILMKSLPSYKEYMKKTGMFTIRLK